MAFTDVASSSEVCADASFAARIGDTRLLLTRVDGDVRAVENRCPHLNLAMTRGPVKGRVVQCPWHGSTFDMCTGENLDWIGSIAGLKPPQWSRALIAFGKKPSGLRTFATREEGGRVLVDI